MKPPTFLSLLIAATCVATIAHAEARKKNPTSKMYVADEVGQVQIDTGLEIDDLTKKSVYNAEGTAIQTKPNSNASVVLSNGTGVFFDVSTRVKIRTFQQDSFRPNRDDIEDEPSLSRTHLYVDHGVIGVSTSKLVAGSTMVYETSLATAFIRGRQAVITAQDNLTVISMVQGEATVQAGPLDKPHLVRNRQQIIIRPGKKDEQNIVEVQDIPGGGNEEDSTWLEERVETADAARKLVYFSTQARPGEGGSIALFDGAQGAGTGTDSGGNSGNEIVPVPVAPAAPPVQPNVSPANLTSK
jgi:hypothetical protein